MKIINFFFLIIFIFFSKNLISNENNQNIDFVLNSFDTWELSCSEIDKKFHNKNQALSKDAIINALQKKYSPGFGHKKEVWENAQFSTNQKDNIISITQFNEDGEGVNILNEMLDENNEDYIPFCKDKKNSKYIIKYKTLPIYFFETKNICDENYAIDREYIYYLLLKNLPKLSNAGQLSRRLEDNKYDIKDNLGWFKENIEDYNRMATRGSIKDVKINFTVKNINQYLNLENENNTLNKLIENNIPEEDTKLDEPLESCKNLSDEKLETRPDCEEEKNIKDENKRIKKEKNDEISKINQILDEIDNLVLNDKPKNYFGQIYRKELDDLVGNINNLIRNANYNSDLVEKEIALNEIEINFNLLKDKISKSISIYDNLNHYLELCINKNSSIYKHTNFSDFEERCQEISSIDNIESIFSEKEKDNYYNERHNKIIIIKDNYPIIENEIESIRKQIEDAKKTEALILSKKEEYKSEINNLTKQIKDKINIINSNINKLNDANKDFNPENPITDLQFINKPMDEAKWDNEIAKYNNLNDQFTNDLDNIKNDIKKSQNNIDEFGLNIEQFNNELVNLAKTIKNYKSSFETYKSNWIAREKLLEEDKIKKDKIKKDLADQAEKKAKKDKEEKNQAKAKRIIDLDNAITENIKNINQKIKDLTSEVKAYNDNFDPINSEEKDFNVILDDVKASKSSIESLLREYENEIDSLSDNYDFEKYGLDKINKLDRKIISFEDKIEDIDLSSLKNEISKANKLIASKSDQVLEIVGEKSSQIDELTTEKEETEQQLSEKEKEVLSLEEKLKTSESLNKDKEETIASLEDDKLKLQNDLNETRDSKNMIIYILIGILILLSGLLFFLSRRKPSDSNDNNVQTYLSRIDELEQQLRRTANQTAQVSAPDPVINPNTPAPEPKKEPSP